MSSLDSLGLDLKCHLLLKDSIVSPGCFLIPQLLRAVLKQEYSVILVLVKQPLAHYQHVLRKLGLTLTSHLQQRQLKVLDLGQELATGSADIKEDFLGKFATGLEAAVLDASKSSSSGRVSLIIDNLSELHSLHCSCQEHLWTAFLLQILTLEDRIEGQINMTMLVHGDISDDMVWTTLLEHYSDVVLEIEELESGESSEVTGQIHICQRDWGLRSSGVTVERPSLAPHRQVLYKLAETGTRILPQVHSF